MGLTFILQRESGTEAAAARLAAAFPAHAGRGAAS